MSNVEKVNGIFALSHKTPVFKGHQRKQTENKKVIHKVSL